MRILFILLFLPLLANSQNWVDQDSNTIANNNPCIHNESRYTTLEDGVDKDILKFDTYENTSSCVCIEYLVFSNEADTVEAYTGEYVILALNEGGVMSKTSNNSKTLDKPAGNLTVTFSEIEVTDGYKVKINVNTPLGDADLKMIYKIKASARKTITIY